MLKGIVQPFELGAETRLIRSAVKYWKPGKFFLEFFNDTISREENKTIFSGLRIFEMALSNQIHFPVFFSPRKVNLEIPINSGLGQAGITRPRNDFRQQVSSKMTFRRHQITEDDLPQFRLVVSRNWPGSGRLSSVDLVTPENDLPGPGQFRLVLSWNWPGPGKPSSGISPFFTPILHSALYLSKPL
jgi:hypothetical protein